MLRASFPPCADDLQQQYSFEPDNQVSMVKQALQEKEGIQVRRRTGGESAHSISLAVVAFSLAPSETDTPLLLSQKCGIPGFARV